MQLALFVARWRCILALHEPKNKQMSLQDIHEQIRHLRQSTYARFEETQQQCELIIEQLMCHGFRGDLEVEKRVLRDACLTYKYFTTALVDLELKVQENLVSWNRMTSVPDQCIFEELRLFCPEIEDEYYL